MLTPVQVNDYGPVEDTGRQKACTYFKTKLGSPNLYIRSIFLEVAKLNYIDASFAHATNRHHLYR